MASSPPPPRAFLRRQRAAISGFDGDGAPYFTSLRRSPGGGVLAAILSDGRVRFLHAASLDSIGSVPRPAGGPFVRDLCFAGDSRVWICYSTGLVVEWLCAEARARRSFVASPPKRVCVPLRVDADDADERGAFSIAVNASDDILAVGYEEHIIFYDLRGGEAAPQGSSAALPYLGCFSSSHSGPVVQLAWHPVVPRHLLSASDDGLVCLFDTGIRGEDDALVAVLNAEGGVSRFGVFGPQSGFAFVLTRTDALSLWSLASAERVAEFGDLKMRLQDAGVSAEYFVDCWCSAEGRLQLLAGAHDGRLWALDVTPAGASILGTLEPSAHSGTVRTALWAQLAAAAPPGAASAALGSRPEGVVCWTAGEDGQLVQWADAAAVASLPPSAAAASGGSDVTSGPIRRAAAGMWRPPDALHPLHDIRAGGSSRSATAAGGAAWDATSFGQTSARPVSPPSTDAAHSTDLLALLS